MPSLAEVPQGTYRIHTRQTGTTNLSAEEQRARMISGNTKENTQQMFLGEDVLDLAIIHGSYESRPQNVQPSEELKKSLHNLFRQGADMDSYLISVNYPTAGYSEGALMLQAAPVRNLFLDTNKADLIYDHPQSVQRAYWSRGMGMVETYMKRRPQRIREREKITDRGIVPILMGHHIAMIGNKYPFNTFPSMRSIKHHHDHLVFVRVQDIERGEWDMSKYGIPEQQSFFAAGHAEWFASRVNRQLNEWGMPANFAAQQQEKPGGYTASIRYDHEQINRLTQFLLLHRRAYEQAAFDFYQLVAQGQVPGIGKGFFDNKPVQPAFTLQVLPQDDKLATLYVTPSFAATGGPELDGLHLIRNQDQPQHVPDGIVNALHQNILLPGMRQLVA